MDEFAGRRLLVIAILCLLFAAVAVAPAPGGATPMGSGQLRVSQIELACPSPVTGTDRATLVAAAVAQVPGTTSGQASGATGSGGLSTLAPPSVLVTIPGVDQVAAVQAAAGPQVPVVAQGQGGWAAALVAGQVTRVTSGRATGLASVACVAPQSQWWFLGAGSALGRRSVLVVTNPADDAARFDVELLGRDGEVAPVAGRGIDIGGNSSVELRLDALAPGEDVLAVHVTATAGRVGAALSDTAAEVGDLPRGSDYISPSASPDRELVIAGIPGGSGRRTLVLANPGDSYATATTTAITTSGSLELPGLLTVAVPAHSVVSIDLARSLAARSATLRLRSDQPITAAVQATWGTKQREAMWLSAGPTIGGEDSVAGAASVPAGPGLQTIVTVAAPDEAVFGTLTVIAGGTADSAIFSPEAGLPGSGSQQGWEVVPPAGADAATVQRLRINVPAGTQRQLTLSGTEESAALSLNWVSEAGSGPAAISHTTASTGLAAEPKSGKAGKGSAARVPGAAAAKSKATEEPMATGYQWWPAQATVNSVLAVPDPGVLVPAG